MCAVHCVNTELQGPFFLEFYWAALASDLDRRERQRMLQFGADFLSGLQESHNVSLDGDFSILVLVKASEVWDLQIIPLDSPVAEPAQIDPELENAFICHLQNHWFCIRKVNKELYNFDTLYAAPEHLSKICLSAYLSTLKSSGWSIFLVRGNFPRECPISSSESLMDMVSGCPQKMQREFQGPATLLREELLELVRFSGFLVPICSMVKEKYH